MGKIEDYWNEYLEKNRLPKNTPFAGECSFGYDEDSGCELLVLVLLGKKRATCSALAGYEIDNEKLPVEGNYYVLTDWEGTPRGIIKTTKVNILPYDAITWEMAQREGETQNMEEWKEAHDEFFEEDSDLMGYDFTPDMPVVYEEFMLVDSVDGQ